MRAKPTIKILTEPEQVALATARLVADRARQAVANRGRFTIALSGGSTPLAAYKLLGRPPYSTMPEWSRTHLFWGDERCVPFSDQRNNAGEALIALGEVGRVALAHPIDVSGSPRQSAALYRDLLRHTLEEDVLDLVLLGLGPDGHTASLFPGSPALETTGRAVVEVDAPHHIDPQVPRVTLTLETINKARQVAFVVTGASKADVVKEVLMEESSKLPAARVRASGELLWIIDTAAAGVARRSGSNDAIPW